MTASRLATALVVVTSLGCGDPAGDERLAESSSGLMLDQRVADDLLVKILNNGRLTDLNALSTGGDRDLALRLFQVPVSGSCVPETHMTCAFEYFLAVSEYDEQPRQGVFDLGVVGELGDFEWLASGGSDRARIRLKVWSYPREALDRNPSLEQDGHEYIIDVGVNGIERVSTD